MRVSKVLILSIALFCSATAFAQSRKGVKNDTIKIADTARIDMRGRKIGKELIWLRDSINQSLASLKRSISSEKADKKSKASAAEHKLAIYKERVELDIQEIFQETSPNGWKPDLFVTINNDIRDIRRNHKLIMKEAK
jgi:hypothetical protein